MLRVVSDDELEGKLARSLPSSDRNWMVNISCQNSKRKLMIKARRDGETFLKHQTFEHSWVVIKKKKNSQK